MTGVLVMIDPFWAPLVMTVLGLAAAFLGRRLIGPVLALSGFALGLVHGAGIAAAMSSSAGFIRLAPWIFAVLFAALSGLLLRLVLFLSGALLAAAAVASAMTPPPLLAVAIAALLGGGLACAYRNVVFALLTAAFGSLLASSGIVNLAANFSFPIGAAGYFILLAVLFIAGFAFQLKGGKREGSGTKRKRR